MNKSLVTLGVVALLGAGGCAANKELVAETVAGNLAIRKAEASKYLLDAAIPTPLGVMTVKVANPNNVPAVDISDPAADAIKEVAGLGRDAVKTAGTVLGLKEGGNAAIGLVGAATGALGDALNNKEEPNVVNSYNTDNSDNSSAQVRGSEVSRYQSDNNNDSTHSPTVVEQPSPVVVKPEVVTQ